jgi:hypothetical protein
MGRGLASKRWSRTKVPEAVRELSRERGLVRVEHPGRGVAPAQQQAGFGGGGERVIAANADAATSARLAKVVGAAVCWLVLGAAVGRELGAALGASVVGCPGPAGRAEGIALRLG